MNRMIKFRGKRADNGEWVYGSLTFNHDDAPEILWVSEEQEVVDIHIQQDTVCQFTGLRDINGTEIYDGDILDTKTGDLVPDGHSFICRWIDSGFALIYQGRTNGVKEKNNWLNRYPLCQRNVEDLIVMGNIFDNPGLVKQDPNESE